MPPPFLFEQNISPLRGKKYIHLRSIKDNKLYFDGCDTVALAEKYGTPLFVYAENDIIGRFDELRRDFVDRYANTRVAYAAKAFFTLAMAKLVENCGMCVDVVSGGELYTAIKAGFPAERIEFNGNNKSREELEMAVDYGIGRIIIDSLQELALIEDVELYGLHCHVGSQLLDNSSHLQALDILLELVTKVREKLGYELKELNLGGGFGVTYVDEERPAYRYFLDPMMERIDSYYGQLGLDRPNVVIEPGRSIAAEAGITLYTVGSIKEIKGVRKYMSVDGGMTDNIRPALYQAVYTGVMANKAEEEPADVVTVCGKCCESGDILIRDLAVAKPEAGDIFAIYSTGAYGYSMASNYNKNTLPAVVFVKDGEDRLVVRRQTYDDMIKNECI